MRKRVKAALASVVGALGFGKKRRRGCNGGCTVHCGKGRSIQFEPLEQRQLLSIDMSAAPFHRIVDNQVPAYSESGSIWQTSIDTAAYEGDCRYHAAGDGSDAATWNLGSLDPTKTYQLFATWTTDSNHASNAVPFTILDGTTTLATVQMNEQSPANEGTLDGQGWESLGTYQTTSGNLSVRLSDNANGYVVANAVCAVEVPVATAAPMVVDNADPSYAESGSDWLGWTDSGYYGGDCRYHAAGTGQNAASWTFDDLDPTATYQVLTTWVGDSSHASNAPFTVFDDTTALATVRLNQQSTPTDMTIDGQAWQSIGVYDAASGKLVIQLSDDANGNVVADAVRLVEVIPPVSPPAVVDTADPSYAEGGSDWLGWTDSGYYGGDCRYHAAGTGQNTASWTFDDLDPTATYQVLTTWVGDSSHASNAPFTVFDDTTALATVRLNQQSTPTDTTIDGQAWQNMGVYQASSGKLVIQLSDDANGNVVADAVRLVEVIPPVSPPAVVDTADPSYAEGGSDWLGWTDSGYYGGDCRYHAAGTGQNTASWTFAALDPTKTYELLTTWEGDSSHASNAPFTVFDGTAAFKTVSVDQQSSPTGEVIDGSTWQSLGVFQSTSGTLSVQLSDDANGYVVADAVRLVEVDQGLFTSGVSDTSVMAGRVSSTVALWPAFADAQYADSRPRMRSRATPIRNCLSRLRSTPPRDA